VVLSAAAGCVDVVCVTALGGPFASVVTGNLVKAGRSIATADGKLAAGVTTAVGCYTLGVAVGSSALRRSTPGWGRACNVVAAVEVALLAGVAAGWLAAHGHPRSTAARLLLGLAAAAMGVQSAVTISSGLRDASTTYLTGTLTSVVRALIRDPHRFEAGGAVRVVALVFGGAVGAVVLGNAPLWGPALPVALVGAVVFAAALTLSRLERS
jgi:uncharacterized membrane protein YoaK (UPF0700 family)